MPTPVWPASVRYRPARDPYDVRQRFAPPIVSEPESGPVRMRATTTSIWSKVSYQISMPNAEFTTLDAFVRVDLVQATLRFMMPAGRPNTPDPWPSKLVYIDPGTYQPKPDGPDRMLVIFVLNILDW